ncbi:MAG: superoxide dismutase [Fe] [Rickettsiales bacterium]|nr:MAG: superoxide dismutase [Fe] [Rickettsiales bacterium]
MTYCDHSNQEEYPFKLPELPFAKDAFAPHFTPETFEYHHEKHHNAYVTNLNKLLDANKELTDLDLEGLIVRTNASNAAIFNNAAQIWNHSFFWYSIKPGGGGKPEGEMLEAIEKDFGSYENFAAEFKAAAIGQFGSGWVWLVYHNEKLKIMKTSNAETPITQGAFPLIACDVWEHAYYIDYRNKRPDYVSSFLDHMINWEFGLMHLKRATQ